MKKDQRIVKDSLIAYSPLSFSEAIVLADVLNKELFGGVEVVK